jgi:hypothetical protein
MGQQLHFSLYSPPTVMSRERRIHSVAVQLLAI